MRRKIYFFLEQLEINRSERFTVTILMILIIIFSGIYYYHEPVANYDPDQYEKLERIFRERSQQLDQERQGILVRYQPSNDLAATRDQPSIGITATRNEPVLEEVATNETGRLIDSVADEDRINETMDTAPGIIQDIININTASVEQLVTLPGIGPAYASRIVEWREENGLFTEKEQLLDIRGIGERRLEQLIPFIEL